MNCLDNAYPEYGYGITRYRSAAGRRGLPSLPRTGRKDNRANPADGTAKCRGAFRSRRGSLDEIHPPPARGVRRRGPAGERLPCRRGAVAVAVGDQHLARRAGAAVRLQAVRPRRQAPDPQCPRPPTAAAGGGAARPRRGNREPAQRQDRLRLPRPRRHPDHRQLPGHAADRRLHAAPAGLPGAPARAQHRPGGAAGRPLRAGPGPDRGRLPASGHRGATLDGGRTGGVLRPPSIRWRGGAAPIWNG